MHSPDKLRTGTKPRGQQRGATVLMSVLLVLALLCVVLTAALVVVLGEQRSAANQIRMLSASAAADAALAEGLAYLHRHLASLIADGARWSSCSLTDVELPCGDGVRNEYGSAWVAARNLPILTATLSGAHVHVLAHLGEASEPLREAVTLIAEATSSDGLARARRRQTVRNMPLVIASAPAPLIASGAIDVRGQVSVVANTDGAGPGQPASVWAEGNASFADEARSCVPSVFLPTGAQSATCPVLGSLSSAAVESVDVFDRDGAQGSRPDVASTVSDPLMYVFGLARAKANALQGEAAVLEGCSALGAESTGLFWVNGSCLIGPGVTIGQPDRPTLLLVTGDQLSLGAGSRLWGLVVVIAVDATLVLGANAQLRGAVVASGALHLTGQGAVMYDAPALAALVAPGQGLRVSLPVPGSWRDW